MIGPSKHSFIYVCAANVCHLYIVRSVESSSLHSINYYYEPTKICYSRKLVAVTVRECVKIRCTMHIVGMNI